MKGLIKYFCFGATVAGVTAPVTYFTTREDIKENEEFKTALNERNAQKSSIDDLNKKIEEKGKKIVSLESCIENAKKNPNSIKSLKQSCLNG